MCRAAVQDLAANAVLDSSVGLQFWIRLWLQLLDLVVAAVLDLVMIGSEDATSARSEGL